MTQMSKGCELTPKRRGLSRRQWLAAVPCLLAVACTGDTQPEPAKAAAKQQAASVPQPEGPPNLDHIVSLGPAVTEILFALGAGPKIAGVDKASRFPAEASKLPQLDYFRKVSAEGILGLQPTVVFAMEGSGPASTLEKLRSSGIHVIDVPGADNTEEALARIRFLGEKLGAQEQAEALCKQFSAQLAAVETLRKSTGETPKVLFVYARGPGALFVAGTKSPAEQMINLAGGKSAVTAFEGFRPLTAEAVIEAAPDAIVVPTRGLESLGGIDGLLTVPGVAQTPAGRTRRVVAIDDLKLLGFGPRAPEALRELFAAIHPSSEDA